MASRTKLRIWTAMKAINDPAKMPCGAVLCSLEGEGDLAFTDLRGSQENYICGFSGTHLLSGDLACEKLNTFNSRKGLSPRHGAYLFDAASALK